MLALFPLPFNVCIFIDFLKGFIHFLLRFSVIFIKAIVLSLSCASAILQCLGPTVLELLGSSGDILSWLLLILFLSDIWAPRFGKVIPNPDNIILSLSVGCLFLGS